jgi:hypothetical protein
LGFFFRARAAISRSSRTQDAREEHGSRFMRTDALKLWIPAAAVVGAALWFTLIPGRSGAG